MKIEVVSKQIIELDVDTLAKAFASLDDDSQAQFFVKVAEHAAETFNGSADTQWWYVGRHLRECECSTEAGREVVRTIAHAMDSPDNQ